MFITQHELVVFDVETTDPDLGEPQIIDIGAAKLTKAFVVSETFDSLICPSDLDLVTEYTTNKSGINSGMLVGQPKWKDKWEEFAKFTKYASCILVSWSGFDPRVLKSEYKRLGLGYPHNEFCLDAMSMIYFFCSWYGYKPSGYSLNAIANRFQILRSARHRAFDDAITTVHVLQLAVKQLDEDDERSRHNVS